jgi:hypothetical protein
MRSTWVSRMTLAAVAAAGLSVPAAAVSAPLASAAPAPQSQCSAAVAMPAAGYARDEPANSCTDQKQQCMSASVQEGIYGERYVPPDAVAMCMQAYRDCANANTDSGTGAVG